MLTGERKQKAKQKHTGERKSSEVKGEQETKGAGGGTSPSWFSGIREP